MRDGLKIFRDPIYDLIYFDKKEDESILQIIDTPEFQRLRRIKQLGLSSYTYPSSNHDRFSHSIGVCFVSGILVENLHFDDIEIKLDAETKVTLDRKGTKLLIQLAAILHDIGHGPFSHAFERAIKSKIEKTVSLSVQIHEDYSKKIISSARIKSIIENVNDPLVKRFGVKWLCDILSGTFDGPKWVEDIISSQFDADRIDYLLRDSYMCGVKYATFDWQWIFKNMFIGDIPMGINGSGRGIVFDGNKGIHSLESFILSRYHMYEQVYFHKTTRGFEAIVNAIFKRLGVLIEAGEMTSKDFLGDYFLFFFKDYSSIDNYLHLDDSYMITHFHHWAKHSKDDILRNLCLSFVYRKPFKMVWSITNNTDDFMDSHKKYNELVEKYKPKLGDAFEYYFLEDSYNDNPYKDTYLLSKSAPPDRIWLGIEDKAKDLSEESAVIKALRNNTIEVNRIFINRDFL